MEIRETIHSVEVMIDSSSGKVPEFHIDHLLSYTVTNLRIETFQCSKSKIELQYQNGVVSL